MAASSRHYRGGFDLHLGALLQQARHHDQGHGGKLAAYDWEVAFAVAALTDTRVFTRTGLAVGKRGFNSTTGVIFVGDEDDTAVANELFIIWLKDVRRLTRKVYGGGNTWGMKHTSYAIGLGYRLKVRAQELHVSNSVALVLRSKQDAIMRWEQKHIAAPAVKEQKKRKSRDPKIDSEAFHRGYADGAGFNMATKIVKGGDA